MTTFLLTTARTRSPGNQRTNPAAAQTPADPARNYADALCGGNDPGTQNVQIGKACAVVGP